jgi:hypothetical protein
VKTYGGDGFAGFGSPDYDPTMTAGGSGQGGLGGGEGGVADVNSDTFGSGASQGGGGGGHALPGMPGLGNAGQNLYGSVHSFLAALRGDGGGTYPAGSQAHRMLTPSAGSGGGAAGDSRNNGGTYDSVGGSGGAGGGFLDITASGSIFVRGTIDAAGGPGGNGYYDASFTASGGGGGGAGGGVRLLTPFDINVSGGVITTAGGAGGVAASPTNAPNHGGAGGSGRIVMEDGDSVITGLGAATLVPNEGDTGFYRGVFDAGRFKGGGLEPAAVTAVFLAGSISPKYVNPVQSYGTSEDFVAGVPVQSSRGVGNTSILIEARGYPLRSDGTVDMTAGTGWYSVGYFRDSGVEERPTWIGAASPGDVTLPSGNVGAGITNLDFHAYLQVRVTFFLPTGIGPFDPGPYLDRWNLHFTYDQ